MEGPVLCVVPVRWWLERLGLYPLHWHRGLVYTRNNQIVVCGNLRYVYNATTLVLLTSYHTLVVVQFTIYKQAIGVY